MPQQPIGRNLPPGLQAQRQVSASAMFDNLSQSLAGAWKSLQKDAKLTPENLKDPLKEIRRALLEADVSLPVVRRFVKKVGSVGRPRKMGIGGYTAQPSLN